MGHMWISGQVNQENISTVIVIFAFAFISFITAVSEGYKNRSLLEGAYFTPGAYKKLKRDVSVLARAGQQYFNYTKAMMPFAGSEGLLNAADGAVYKIYFDETEDGSVALYTETLLGPGEGPIAVNIIEAPKGVPFGRMPILVNSINPGMEDDDDYTDITISHPEGDK